MLGLLLFGDSELFFKLGDMCAPLGIDGVKLLKCLLGIMAFLHGFSYLVFQRLYLAAYQRLFATKPLTFSSRKPSLDSVSTFSVLAS